MELLTEHLRKHAMFVQIERQKTFIPMSMILYFPSSSSSISAADSPIRFNQ